jgi:hypothetical protein
MTNIEHRSTSIENCSIKYASTSRRHPDNNKYLFQVYKLNVSTKMIGTKTYVNINCLVKQSCAISKDHTSCISLPKIQFCLSYFELEVLSCFMKIT